MGGINHKPTPNSSLAVGVEAAHDISQLIVKLHTGNMSIEQAILAIRGGSPRFGIAKLKIQQASDSFNPVAADMVVQRIKDVIALVSQDDYRPFGLDDPEAEIDRLIAAGLVSDSPASRQAATDMVGGNYLEPFDHALELAQKAVKAFKALHAETTWLANDQGVAENGCFWQYVEAGKTPWRALFMAALVPLDELTNYWAASAALSTQAYYYALGAPDLLAQLEAPASLTA